MQKTVTKIFRFCYGHYLPDYAGKCRYQHGHNAMLEVEVSGGCRNISESYDSMIIDFSKLKDIVNQKIIVRLDHFNLNDILPKSFLPPVAENIVEWIWKELKEEFEENLIRVRLYETDDSYAEIKSL